MGKTAQDYEYPDRIKCPDCQYLIVRIRYFAHRALVHPDSPNTYMKDEGPPEPPLYNRGGAG